MKTAPWLLLAGLALSGDDGFARGVSEYGAGRFAEALAAFAAAEQALGPTAPAELLCNRALAAFRAGDLRAAEIAVEKAAARGGEGFYAWRDFLLGSVALARSERAEAETRLPDAGPTALDRAIAWAESAARSWRAAALRQQDWPEARRNAERALRAAAAMRERMAAAPKQQRNIEQIAWRQDTPPDPDRPNDAVEHDPRAQAAPTDPAAALVERLLARLDEKEREKQALRRALQATPNAAVERDW
jgi:hypothetical protein